MTDTMQATRQKIIELLKERGQATVEELSDAVGLTQMAVRHHLNVLQGEKLVAAPTVRRRKRPGRPQQLYALTEAADELFPENYCSLTSYLLEEIKQSLGAPGLDALFRRVGDRLAAEVPSPRQGQSPEERLNQLVQLLGEKGFVARWGVEGGQYVVHLLSCPYRQIARQHQEVCSLDRQIIERVLNVSPVKVACLAKGDERCTYQTGQLTM